MTSGPDAPECMSCQMPIELDEPVQAFLCAHVIHVECLDNFASVKGVNRDDLACPKCKLAPESARLLEAGMGLTNPVPPPEHEVVDDVRTDDDPLIHAGTEADTETAERTLTPAHPAKMPPVPDEPIGADAQTPFGSQQPAVPKLDTTIAPATGGSASSEMAAGVVCVSQGAAAQHSTAIAQYPTEDLCVECAACGGQCELAKARVVSKMLGTFKCNVCRSRSTTFYRNFGEWPTRDFQGASLEEQQAFMRASHELDGKALIASARMFLTKYERHERTYEDGGAFWPLAKWAHDGFDAGLIEEHTCEEDKMNHKVLGLCYRVAILHKATRGADGQESSKRFKPNCKVLKALPAPSPAVEQTPAPDAEAAAVADGSDAKSGDSNACKSSSAGAKASNSSSPASQKSGSGSGSGGSSSKSSSSSSSSDKKKKKKKKKKKNETKNKQNKKEDNVTSQ